MILRDRVTVKYRDTAVVLGTYPARVSYTRVQGVTNPGTQGPYRLGEWIEIMVGPGLPWDGINHQVEWRGVLYDPDGPAAVIMRGDKVHHLTIGLKRITG